MSILQTPVTRAKNTLPGSRKLLETTIHKQLIEPFKNNYFKNEYITNFQSQFRRKVYHVAVDCTTL